jgi:hypothetical protein
LGTQLLSVPENLFARPSDSILAFLNDSHFELMILLIARVSDNDACDRQILLFASKINQLAIVSATWSKRGTVKMTFQQNCFTLCISAGENCKFPAEIRHPIEHKAEIG